MDEDEVHATPPALKRRRLGLRAANSTPGLRLQAHRQTPSVGGKTETEIHKRNKPKSQETPVGLPPLLEPSSTGCRRPGLTRKRKDLPKKRLKFAAGSEVTNKPEHTESSLSSQIAAAEAQLKSYESRQRKITELELSIDIWRNGFIAAMEDLQAVITPRQTKEALLRQLAVPLEMLQHLDED